MARIKMVTRTIVSTTATCMVCYVSLQQASIEDFTIDDTFTSNDDLLKALKKKYDTSERIIVVVQNYKEEEQLYGMPEEVFKTYATKLPPRDKGGEEND